VKYTALPGGSSEPQRVRDELPQISAFSGEPENGRVVQRLPPAKLHFAGWNKQHSGRSLKS
jgi:hypothetical protein